MEKGEFLKEKRERGRGAFSGEKRRVKGEGELARSGRGSPGFHELQLLSTLKVVDDGDE